MQDLKISYFLSLVSKRKILSHRYILISSTPIFQSINLKIKSRNTNTNTLSSQWLKEETLLSSIFQYINFPIIHLSIHHAIKQPAFPFLNDSKKKSTDQSLISSTWNCSSINPPLTARDTYQYPIQIHHQQPNIPPNRSFHRSIKKKKKKKKEKIISQLITAIGIPINFAN